MTCTLADWSLISLMGLVGVVMLLLIAVGIGLTIEVWRGIWK